MNLAQKPAMALNLGPNPSPKTFPAILGKLSFNVPGPYQWAKAIWVRKWSHGPPGILALGASSSPHRLQSAYDGPWTIGHAKDQRTPKAPLITHPSIMAMVLARTQNTKEGPKWPNLKDNGDKPPAWMIPKSNQGEVEPRGTISQSIMGIYVHITIMNNFLR
ncbi:hypothetical protein O181_050566 [Austropuccinia psidii MF-1]|uniref:Uncharacterized protein n=1 Tax=Austropuccinia psidii MF-1 TaxID=1389203 RepID=A0A9Q3HMH4_9BASI|nr:hypothetical protein [Austropuccinia psidii MF-1]